MTMNLLRRLIAWIFYFGFLSAVGAGVFMFVRYRPRCIIAEPLIIPMHLSADGSHLVTLRLSKTKAGRGPVKVWDTDRGQFVRELIGDFEIEHRWERSQDDRHLALCLADGVLRLVDWHTGETWRFEEPTDVKYYYCSPKGCWLHAYGNAPPGGVLIDLTTHQINARLGEGHVEFSPDGRWAFARKGSFLDIWDLAKAKKTATIVSDLGMLASPDGGRIVTWLFDDRTDRAQAKR